MTRVSTRGLYLQSLSAILNQQSALARTQQQVSSGRRYQTAAGDPVAAARELDLNRALRRLDQLERNSGVAEHRLGLEDGAMAEVTDTMQRVRELALLINSDTNDGAGQAVANELDQLLSHLVQVANASDGEGGYLFSGFAANGQPFIREGAVVNYRGDQGQRFIQIGTERRIADGDSGAQVFQFVRNGNGTFTTAAAASNSGNAIVGAGALVDAGAWPADSYTIGFITDNDYEVRNTAGTIVATGSYAESGVIVFDGIEVDMTGPAAAGDSFSVEPSTNQDLFTTVQNLIAVAGRDPSSAGSRAVYHSDINSAIADIDRAMEHIAGVRTRVGTRLAALDDQATLNADTRLSLQTTLSDVRDVDIVEAASRMELQRVSLQAAQQAFVRVQNLSLFRLLG